MEKTYEEQIERFVSDSDIEEWEECEKELQLYVCSTCGLIASELIEHKECCLQDWWHLDAKCLTKLTTDGIPPKPKDLGILPTII